MALESNPDSVDFLTFFSSEPIGDPYDDFTFEYEMADRNQNRLRFVYNELDRSVSTHLLLEESLVKSVYFEGLVSINFFTHNEQTCTCRSGGFSVEL